MASPRLCARITAGLDAGRAASPSGVAVTVVGADDWLRAMICGEAGRPVRTGVLGAPAGAVAALQVIRVGVAFWSHVLKSSAAPRASTASS